MNYFFIADTHFGHANIIKYSNRPFNSVEEMDEILIQNWNSIITKNDTVYHLGDFSFAGIDLYRRRLNGHINFIKGSHDREGTVVWPRILDINIPELKDEYGNQRLIVLCHYAMRSWPLSHYASWHLFGHHHGRLEPYGLSFDVGVDTNNYFPYSLEEVEKKMATLKPIVDFRNKS